ncbi:hypothetical protein CVT24_006121 [Panaeolus cyanescens]|uniref:Methyltransferase type 11 domain-containing protein n=1 Tax=Panaeolus cyanescens TaxID=181874 RepID=A0A409YDY8_9AGAR|nr:hypothetical protein CVT24_006121 [Panaeolus cyanescens]
MKLSNALAIAVPSILGICVALVPTLVSLLIRPWLVFNPHEISKLFMSYVWVVFSDGIDKGDAKVKKDLVEGDAYGVVLDIGAGHGHGVQYLNPSRVKQYIALEPNTHMHPRIRAKANSAGFFESDGRLVILGCGAEDTDTILATLRSNSTDPDSKGPHLVDTIVSIFTLCSVPNPANTIQALVQDVLKPDGLFLYYEHVKSERDDIVWWQSFWTPIWGGLFGGCCIDRPTDKVIRDMRDGAGNKSMWKEAKQWDNEDDDPEELFKRTLGKFIKA